MSEDKRTIETSVINLERLTINDVTYYNVPIILKVSYGSPIETTCGGIFGGVPDAERKFTRGLPNSTHAFINIPDIAKPSSRKQPHENNKE